MADPEKHEKRFDDLTKIVTSLETSARWIRGIIAIILPMMIMGCVYAVMMWSSQGEFRNDIRDHLRHHSTVLLPAINANSNRINSLEAKHGIIEEKILNLKYRVDSTEIKINDIKTGDLNRISPEKKRAFR